MPVSAVRRLVVLLALAACGCHTTPEPASQYVLHGQILAVLPDRMSLTIRHEAIPGLMDAMTMTFPVADRRLLEGRVPGETVAATLEVRDAVGRLVSITHTGSAPLPSPSSPPAGGTIRPGDPLPDAALIDQMDRRRSLAEWRGTALVLTFTRAACRETDDCGRVAARFSELQRAIAGDAALADRVRLLSISADPARDTPAALAAVAARLHADPARWTWLTGDPVTVQRLASRFGVDTADAAGQSPGTTTVRTVTVDARGRVRAVHDGVAWTTDAVLADLRDAAQSAP